MFRVTKVLRRMSSTFQGVKNTLHRGIVITVRFASHVASHLIYTRQVSSFTPLPTNFDRGRVSPRRFGGSGRLFPSCLFYFRFVDFGTNMYCLTKMSRNMHVFCFVDHIWHTWLKIQKIWKPHVWLLNLSTHFLIGPQAGGTIQTICYEDFKLYRMFIQLFQIEHV